MSKIARRVAHKFSAEQTCYMLARATFETLEAEHKAQAIAAGLVYADGQSAEEDERIFEAREDLYESIGARVARNTLRAAEEAMVAWSIEKTGRRFPAHAATLRETAAAAKLHPHDLWPRVVDIASRLAA